MLFSVVESGTPEAYTTVNLRQVELHGEIMIMQQDGFTLMVKKIGLQVISNK